MHPLMNIAIQAAREAGRIITRNIDKLDRIAITEKSTNDFVSDVDIQAERAIIETVRKSYPDHAFLAEEGGKMGNGDVVWIIDPLDGTRNFLHGFPHYAVSIAVEVKGKIEHGLIHDPIRQEFFSATRGNGAFLNQKRIRVSQRFRLHQALLATGFPHQQEIRIKKYLATFEALFTESGGIRRAGAAALDLAYVAAGRLDGFWEFGLKPWDIAAGALLIKEAGGLVSDFNGTDDFLDSGDLIAGNPKIFKALLQTIHPILNSAES